MEVTFKPKLAKGEITAPPSKSMGHRLLICGAFTKKSTINNIYYSDDILATVNCLEALGAKTQKDGNNITIGGLNINNIKEGTKLFCNESGSTLRFLIPLAFIANKTITFYGSKRLFSRPLNEYQKLAEQNGIYFNLNKDTAELTIKGKLNNNTFVVGGDKSSQFISGLMFMLPFLNKDAYIEIENEITSISYINLTVQALKEFGVNVNFVGNKITFKKSFYKEKNIQNENDYSNAAFLEAFNILGGNVKINGLNENSLQGDKVYNEIFKKILKNNNQIIDITNCPDLAPLAFTIACFKGSATFIGTNRLKLKESDRAEVSAKELKKFGADITVLDNTVKIIKKDLSRPTTPLNGSNDHRIVMSLSVLCSYLGGTIKGAEAVNKSYPNFFEDIKSLDLDFTIKN